MMPILLYPAKLTLAAGLLYGYYRLFLRNRQFHRYNRLYLLLATAIAVITPFISIPLYLPPPAEGASAIAGTLRAISLVGRGEPDPTGIAITSAGHWLTFSHGIALLYAAGLVAGLFALLRSMIYMIRLRKRY